MSGRRAIAGFTPDEAFLDPLVQFRIEVVRIDDRIDRGAAVRPVMLDAVHVRAFGAADDPLPGGRGRQLAIDAEYRRGGGGGIGGCVHGGEREWAAGASCLQCIASIVYFCREPRHSRGNRSAGIRGGAGGASACRIGGDAWATRCSMIFRLPCHAPNHVCRADPPATCRLVGLGRQRSCMRRSIDTAPCADLPGFSRRPPVMSNRGPSHLDQPGGISVP